MANLPSPIPAETAAVPIDNRDWFHDHRRFGGLEFWLRSLPLQHNDLVSKGDDLGLKVWECSDGPYERSSEKPVYGVKPQALT
jgi:hypothetical protein